MEMPLTYRGEQVGTLVIGLRRGERDLHDADRRTLGLIATPLAVALQATARRLDEIGIELRGAIDDVRRVVYGLRPIELDNAGLVGALRQRLAGLPASEAGQIRVEMEHPDHCRHCHLRSSWLLIASPARPLATH